MSCGPTHPVVLIRRHGRELGLREHEGLEVLLGVALAVLAWVHEDHVEAGLVAVHGVENDLWGHSSKLAPRLQPLSPGRECSPSALPPGGSPVGQGPCLIESVSRPV